MPITLTQIPQQRVRQTTCNAGPDPVIQIVPEIQNGYILYEGPSRLDGQPIVAIATGFNKSKNAKTGQMIQIWIIRSDLSPLKAIFAGKDISVCGNCKHRPNGPTNPTGMGTCYVNVGQAPEAVFKAYKAGSYRHITENDWFHFRDRRVRIGAYGDPAVLPTGLLRAIAISCERHTAYTHQWNFTDQQLKAIMMASCDTPEEKARAQAKGWRTFRVRLEDEPLQPDERNCPASAEAGHKAQCATCTACHGTGGGNNKRMNIAIIVHGTDWKPRRFRKVRMLQRAHKAFTHLLVQSAYALSRRGIPRKRNRRLEKLRAAARAALLAGNATLAAK